MKSRFHFWPVFFILMCLFLNCLIFFYVFINFDILFAHGKPLHFLSFPYVIFNCNTISLIGYQLNHKAHKIIINDSSIIRVRCFGFGLKKVYKISDIEGFLTYAVSYKKNAGEYLYLISGNERIVKLSTYYHQNYQELKLSLVQHQIRNLANEHWTIWKHISA
ncbi:hypothetical protein ABID99_000820 [Mucilaginibacter sp. OAE612]